MPPRKISGILIQETLVVFAVVAVVEIRRCFRSPTVHMELRHDGPYTVSQ